jgi:hypothetical protein
MTRIRERHSVIGVDPTSEGLAFVFFEGGELVDWGTPLRRIEGDDLAIFDRIAAGCAADVAVVEDPDAPGCVRSPRVAALLRTIAKRARRDGLRVERVPKDAVRQAWRQAGTANKESAAARMAAAFPDLLPFVPPRRKVTMSETRRVHVFDALSLVLHAFGQPPEDLAR